MAAKPQGLGELELEVLKAVWEAPGRTVQEVAEEFAERRGLARTTVLTVMQRLHVKDCLKRRKVKGVYRFWPTQTRGKVLKGLIRDFVETVLDGSPAPFLAYLANTKALTDEQARQLRDLVRNLERQEEGKGHDLGNSGSE
ncbi:MAG: BlaI/MecI/CopY family transcriptional regulator [Candidatus Hydrogenedentes bacterium]|nr:BlaI/MecI/CopY family transcriptional regulator [Candidatus Hydrogenedentota bacterium]